VSSGDTARYAAVLFDLDGTLVDTRPGIASSVRAAVADVAPGLAVPSLDRLLGLRLDELVGALAPSLSPGERDSLAAAFREHYDQAGWRESSLYPHVAETLAVLRRAGVRSFVVTNKRSAPAHAIIGLSGIDGYVEALYTPDGRATGFHGKSEMGQDCLRDHRLLGEQCLVVGDSEDDLLMAADCGTSFAAAAWGYGDAASLVSAREGGVGYHPSSERQLLVLASMAELPAHVTPGHPSEAVHES
jgi:phosphoglycolate phosphatase